MLVIEGLRKQYGETVALADASIRFEAGTIHTILGENGSGKSTLVKLLSGITTPNGGTILLEGTPLSTRGPAAVQSQGIATVLQEVLIAPDRDVIDNVLLGADGLFTRHIPRAARRQAATAALAPLAREAIDPDSPAGRLPLASQQLVVLARALYRKPRVLILDEVTAALDFGDRDAVFRVMKDLAASGVLIIFITHRMDEVMKLSNEVTVLRSGRTVATLPIAEATPDGLLALMAPERKMEAAQ